MEQNNLPQENENRSQQGTFEWLKFIVFLGGILLITILVIRVIGPLIFTQYVPPIVGITETTDDSEIMVDEGVDSQDEAEEPAVTEPEGEDANEAGETDGTDSEPDPEESTEPAESVDSDAGEASGSEPDPLETEEETSSKVEEPADETKTEPVDEPVAEFTTYIVLPGETLTSIAAAHEMTVEELISANELINPNYVTAGQEIRIPK